MGDAKELESNSTYPEESPSGSKDLSKTLPEEAFNHFIQGKRHMLVKDYTFAVQSLSTACELYVKHFGELALECGEVYYLYGKALFYLTQQSGNLISKGPTAIGGEEEQTSEEEEEEEEDKENESESGDDKGNEEKDNTEAADSNGVEVEEKEPSESTDSPQAVDNETKDVKEKESEPNAPEADVSIQNESAVEEKQPEEDDDLEVAWNNLEIAKTIFSRQGENNRDSQLKVAEIRKLLAEICLESDNYTAAIDELQECLLIQQKYLSPDDRSLAETLYEMGLAYCLQKMYDKGLESYGKTVEIFKGLKEKLENTPVSETIGGFEAADRQKDLEECDSILADLNEKIEDTKECMRNARNELQNVIFQKEGEIKKDLAKIDKPESSTSKPVSNITHLLKRKKPDHEEDKESDSKRIKISQGVPNGDSTVSK